MTGANGDEDLFKALTSASTVLLKMGMCSLFVSFFYLLLYSVFQGELCKPYRQSELNNNTANGEEVDNDRTISLEQLERAMNAEACLVQWLENPTPAEQIQSLEERINNYHQDALR